MPHKPAYVANSFLWKARQDNVTDVSPLKIQKLVYYLYGWYLVTKDDRVVGELFEAWPYGPVLSSIYHEFKGNGRNPIKSYAVDIDPGTGERQSFRIADSERDFYDVFDRVWDKYKDYSGLRLSTLTHARGTPWHTARQRGSVYLDDDEIRDYFVKLAS